MKSSLCTDLGVADAPMVAGCEFYIKLGVQSYAMHLHTDILYPKGAMNSSDARKRLDHDPHHFHEHGDDGLS